jgi:hypothetical protein
VRNSLRAESCAMRQPVPWREDLFDGFHFYRKSRLKAHGFNRGMKGGVARHPLLGMVRATNLLYNRTYERCSSHW